jgi:hypothetical protein
MLRPFKGQYVGYLPDWRGMGAIKEFAHETRPLIEFDVTGLEFGVRFLDKGYDSRAIEIRRYEPAGYFPEILT